MYEGRRDETNSVDINLFCCKTKINLYTLPFILFLLYSYNFTVRPDNIKQDIKKLSFNIKHINVGK